MASKFKKFKDLKEISKDTYDYYRTVRYSSDFDLIISGVSHLYFSQWRQGKRSMYVIEHTEGITDAYNMQEVTLKFVEGFYIRCQ